jgi:sugar O-acyltransferase (sialic acid O-acetyltransferase NeuD family)
MSDIRLLILGAGSFAIETLEIAELAGGFRPLGFVVSDPPADPASHAGLPVYGESALPSSLDDAHIVGGIVSNRRRGFIERLLARGFQPATVTHPTAIVSPRATLMPGAVIGAGVIVASNTQIGAHTLLNRGANIGHDNDIGDYVTVSPGTVLAGAIQVGRGAYIGAGAVIRDHLSIGEGAVVAAGAVVVKPVPARTLVAGCPAAIIRSDVDGL